MTQRDVERAAAAERAFDPTRALRIRLDVLVTMLGAGAARLTPDAYEAAVADEFERLVAEANARASAVIK